MKILQFNKRATFNYVIEKSIVAGVSLLGKEVKLVKARKFSLNNSFVIFVKNRPFLTHYILPDRLIPLLMTKRQISLCLSFSKIKGYTIIPIKILISDNNYVKTEVCIAKGASKLDKKRKIKERDERRIGLALY